MSTYFHRTHRTRHQVHHHYRYHCQRHFLYQTTSFGTYSVTVPRMLPHSLLYRPRYNSYHFPLQTFPSLHPILHLQLQRLQQRSQLQLYLNYVGCSSLFFSCHRLPQPLPLLLLHQHPLHHHLHPKQRILAPLGFAYRTLLLRHLLAPLRQLHSQLQHWQQLQLRQPQHLLILQLPQRKNHWLLLLVHR